MGRTQKSMMLFCGVSEESPFAKKIPKLWFNVAGERTLKYLGSLLWILWKA